MLAAGDARVSEDYCKTSPQADAQITQICRRGDSRPGGGSSVASDGAAPSSVPCRPPPGHWLRADVPKLSVSWGILEIFNRGGYLFVSVPWASFPMGFI